MEWAEGRVEKRGEDTTELVPPLAGLLLRELSPSAVTTRERRECTGLRDHGDCTRSLLTLESPASAGRLLAAGLRELDGEGDKARWTSLSPNSLPSSVRLPDWCDSGGPDLEVGGEPRVRGELLGLAAGDPVLLMTR